MKKLIIFLPLLLFAQEITLDFILSKPRSIARDYYIYRFLDQNITPDEANIVFYKIKNVNKKIFIKYANKSDNKDIKKIAKCMRLKPKEFLKEDGSCIAAGMSPYRFISLDTDNRKKILEKIKRFKKTYKIFYILSSKHPFELLLKNEDIFFDVFNHVGDRFREKYLNQTIDTKFIEKLKDKKEFDSFVNIAITDPKLNKLHFSFFNISTKNLSSYSSFLLAINAIRYDRFKIAKKFLDYSYKKSYFTFDKDKSLFWLYMITKQKKYLEKLSNSSDINIYSLYAKEILNKKVKNYIKFDFDNHKKDKDINDPFVWLDILHKIKRLKNNQLREYAKNFKSKELLPIYAFIMERFYRYKLHPFITPYEDILKDNDKKDKILIYSLARQESRFIPSSISSSFALGSMQIMPFLAKALAKEKKIKSFDLDMMFFPKINVDFAKTHLKYLQKKLKHPLLIAYAYNGGIGFVKRKVIKSNIFKYKKFEPFLGMELIKYPESRRYGKKVLANYVIYSHLLGKDIKLLDLIKSLREFDHNHRF